MRLAPVLLAFACSALPAFAQSEEDVMNRIETIHGNAEGFFDVFGAMQDAVTQYWNNPSMSADTFVEKVTAAMRDAT